MNLPAEKAVTFTQSIVNTHNSQTGFQAYPQAIADFCIFKFAVFLFAPIIAAIKKYKGT